MTTGQVRSASECVRRSHCAAGRTPTQTRHRTHLSGGRADSIHTTTPNTTKTVLSVMYGVAVWTIATNVLRLQIFRRQQSSVVGNPIHTTEADATQTIQFYRVWRGNVN